MRILAFDPGVHIGVCCLDFDDRRSQARYVCSEVMSLQMDQIASTMINARDPVDESWLTIAIESSKPGLYKAAHRVRKSGRQVDISGPLQDMAHVAGMIAGIAVGLDLDVAYVPATEWRRVVCGKSNADDAMVGRMIPILVSGWPKRSSVHVRDAAGTAIGAARKIAMGRRMAKVVAP